MKRTQKLFALLSALAVLLCMALTAAAAGTTYTLTLHNTGATPHTFEIYQVFTGDLAVNESGQKVLSNVVWGSGVTPAGQAAIGNAADCAEQIQTESDAKAFANTLVSGSYLTNATVQTVQAGQTESVAGLAPGYYLVKDSDLSQSVESGAYTAYILEVVGDVTASAKLDTPSVEKKVQDINDSQDGDISDNPWQDSADYDVGDEVPFRITGTLPGNFDAYESYYYSFADEMSSGLTYLENASVLVSNGGVETDITAQAAITSAPSANGTVLTVTIEDLKALSGVTVDHNSTVIVRYSARLNENAVSGGAGNSNTVQLTYSNNPNGGTEIGTTPKEKAVIFTYQFIIEKADENGTPLPNAGFTLYKKDHTGAWREVRVFEPGSATTFTFSGLGDGDYKLVETAVPDGFNKFEDLEFTITGSHDANAADPALTGLNGAGEGGVITLGASQQASVSLENGAISTVIINKSGSVLPSTGGIGTTIFYIIGGLLAVGAVVLLITKKRMNAEE